MTERIIYLTGTSPDGKERSIDFTITPNVDLKELAFTMAVYGLNWHQAFKARHFDFYGYQDLENGKTGDFSKEELDWIQTQFLYFLNQLSDQVQRPL